MGQRIAVLNRSIGVPLLDKDLTLASVYAMQPVTPIFQIRQAVRLARADERIAQAKADAAAAALRANVQGAYFALLIAQRQQTAAEARAKNPVRLASTASPAESVEKALAAANHRVQELTGALRMLIGGSDDEWYELAAPAPVEEANGNGPVPALGLERNPDVVEAREGVEKAKAALNLAKLNYMPEVAGVGGYMYQNAIPLLPRDYSYVGVVATWTVFDFGKRERLVAERSTQLRMAQANLELVRAKVAASSTKASADLDRSRRMLRLARRVAAISRFDGSPNATAEQADADAEMFQADLDFRVAMIQMTAAQ
jgi:outer membrane protein TolC